MTRADSPDAARDLPTARAGEVAQKLARVRAWLEDSGYGAALFTSQPAVACVTAGLEDRMVRNEEPGLVWHLAACSVEAALIGATRPGRSWEDAVAAGKAAYRDAGFDGEWRKHVQGGPIGYLSREFDVVPGRAEAAEVITAGTAFAWNPTVQGAKSEDTFVVSASGPAIPVTNTADWPTVRGRPAILST
jgi:Xaa-Pro aminopeptidase